MDYAGAHNRNVKARIANSIVYCCRGRVATTQICKFGQMQQVIRLSLVKVVFKLMSYDAMRDGE